MAGCSVTLTVPDLTGLSVPVAAQTYAAAGWYVGPYDADRAKNPGGLLGTGWQKQTSTDPAQIAQWWARWPHAAIFLHVGRSGAVALDVDHPAKVTGVLAEVLRAHTGPVQLTRDERHSVAGIHRGHYLFAQPPGRDIGNSIGRLGKGWGEVRGRNGVIVVEPSQHVHHGHGGIYRWLRTGPVPILAPVLADLVADASPELDPASLARLSGHRGSVTGSIDPGLFQRGPLTRWTRLMHEGSSRHTAMNEVAAFAYRDALAGVYPFAWAEQALREIFVSSLARDDLGSGSVRSEQDAVAEFDSISLWALGQVEHEDHDQRAATIAVRTYEAPLTNFTPEPDGFGPPGAGDEVVVPAAFSGRVEPLAPSGPGMRFTWASTLAQRASRWLWEEDGHQWIPLGGLVLLGGREGVGKSTLAFRLAAQVTRGTLPGDWFGVPRSVVIAATEDAWEQTIQPRLVAADADLTRVARVDIAESDGVMRGMSLVQDVAALREGCERYDVSLILLDPLLSTVGGSLDTHKDSDVRKALEPLSRLAGDLQLTVIGLIHQNKSTGSDILTRLMGSRAFSAVARAVLLCAEEAEDEPEEDDFGSVGDTERAFVFGQLKSNLGPKVMASIRYRIVGVVTGTDYELGKPIRSSKIEMEPVLLPNNVTESVADEAPKRKSREAPAGRAAGQWLLDYLAENGTSPAALVVDVAKEAGHSPATVQRARKAMGIEPSRVDGISYWSAPPVYIAGHISSPRVSEK